MTTALTTGDSGVPSFFRKISSDGTNWVTLDLNGRAGYYDTNQNASLFVPTYLFWRSNAWVQYDAYSSGATNDSFKRKFGLASSRDLVHFKNRGPVTLKGWANSHVLGARWFVENDQPYLVFAGNGTGICLSWPTDDAMSNWQTPIKIADGGVDPVLTKVGNTYHLFDYTQFGIEHQTSMVLTNPFSVQSANIFGSSPLRLSRMSVVQTGETNWSMYCSSVVGSVAATYVSFSHDTNLSVWSNPVQINEDGQTANSGFVTVTSSAEQDLLASAYETRQGALTPQVFEYEMITTDTENVAYGRTNFTSYGTAQIHDVQVLAFGEMGIDFLRYISDFHFTYVSVARKLNPGRGNEQIWGPIQYLSWRTTDTNSWWPSIATNLVTRANGDGGMAVKVVSSPDYARTRWKVRETVQTVTAPFDCPDNGIFDTAEVSVFPGRPGRTFTSLEYKLSTGLIAKTNHALPDLPAGVRWVLVCKTNDVGFVVGDEVPSEAFYISSDGRPAFSCGANDANVYLTATHSGAIAICNKTNGIAGKIQTKRWTAKCYAQTFNF